MRIAAALCLFAFAATAQAQCPAQTFFEFQVDQQARFIPDSSSSVFPLTAPSQLPKAQAARNLVQFVVDTAGIVDSSSFHQLKVSDPEVVLAARALLRIWRFTPAAIGSCKVRQLVQTPLVERPKRSS